MLHLWDARRQARDGHHLIPDTTESGLNNINIRKIASAGLTALLIGLALCGCSAKTDEDPLIQITEPAVTETTAPVTETCPATEPPTQKTEQPTTEEETRPPLPVLSVTTKRQDKHALDFAEKPVTSYIADEAARKLLDLRQYPAPYYEACFVTLTDPEGNILPEQAYADIRVRGNWTTYYDKKPLRIRFEDKQSMLSLHEGEAMKHWVLLAEYKDPSCLRNKTALSVSREILAPHGLYAADAQLVEVEINGQYWGVYLLTEQQEVNKHRINITKPDPENPNDTKIGYLLEYDGYASHEDDLHQFKVTYADNAPLTPYDGNGGRIGVVYPLRHGWDDTKKNVGFSIKSDILSQAQHDFIASYTDNVYRILYAAAYEQKAFRFNEDFTAIEPAEITPQQAVEAVIDVQSLADMYILSELLCDADLNWSSFFMDVDFGEGGSRKLRFEAPWDFDSAMGLKDRCKDGKGFYAANAIPDLENENCTINPWLAVLAYEDWFRDIVRDTWSRAYDDGVFDRAVEAVGTDTEAFAEAFARNAERWEKKSGSAQKNEEAVSQQEAADALAEWLRTRVDFLNRYWYQVPRETTEPTTEEPTGEPPEDPTDETAETVETTA